MDEPGELLRRLAIGDDALLHRVLADERAGCPCCSPLDAKTHALVCVAALIAMDAAEPSYLWAVDAARAAGASDAEVVGCLLAALPVLGVARVVGAAPKLGLALGYDVGDALERVDSATG